MRTLRNLLAIFSLLVISANGLAQNLSNKGTDFWVGYGHHQFMEAGQSNSQEMILYFAAEQAATVTVSIWGTSWTRTYTVPAGGVVASDLIPKSGAIDARLISLPCSFVPAGTPCGGEGIFNNKAIHITSNVPIVAYAHIYGSASSGASMLMPTETWGYAYTSVNSVQNYATNCFSWMYVIAQENNTVIEVTPITTSRTGKAANTPHTVTLNKGEIYQIMAGPETGSAKPEMTGTKVKSIANSEGKCFSIAVFSGSSRTSNPSSCGSGGGDNDNQQLFPSLAWGKRYLTAPTSSSTGAANKMRNIFKVVVRDPATDVRINGVLLNKLTLQNNSYYTYESNTEDFIEADKPIMVAQFMNGGSTCLNGGVGDPEMIIISPIEQGIKRIGFYRNNREAISTNYLTLIIPTAGIASLRIDGSNTFDHTYPHSKLPGYSVVVKRWSAAPAQSTAYSDSAFTAITYGLGSVESYGYNAGTLINNLAVRNEIYNVADSAVKDTVQQFACKGTPMKLKALVGYKPTNMLWRLSQVPAMSAADVNIANPVVIDSFKVGLGWYYRYELPGTYIFNDTGTFYLPIVNSEPTIENCTRTEEVKVTIVVKPIPFTNLSVNHTGCLLDTVYFSSSVDGGYGHTINKWSWDLDGGTTSSKKDTTKLYATPGTYTIKLRVTTPQGCIGDSARTITIGNKPVASIVATPATICVGSQIVFTDTTTSATSGTWYWDFGNNITASPATNAPQTVTYTIPNNYTVKHVVKTSPTCVSDTVTKVITVNVPPAKPAVNNAITYCQNNSGIPLTATALPGHTLTWYDNPALLNGVVTAPTPSTATMGTVYYYVTQTSTTTGCVSDTSRIQVTVAAAIGNNTISANQTVCSRSPASTLTGSAPSGGSGNYTYQWQQSVNGGTTWTNIAGGTLQNYNPGVLSAGTTKFRREVSSGLCTSISNSIDILVETNLSNFDISASQTICEGTAPALLDGQTPTGGTGTYTFQWQGSTDGVNWTIINGAANEDFQPGPISVKTYFRRITSGGNCPAISSVVTININPTANGNITAPPTSCQYNSAAVNFTATAGTAPFNVQLLVTAPGGVTSVVNQSIVTNVATAINVIPVNSAPGTYTVVLQSVSDNGGCIRTTGFIPVTINVTATPVLSFSPATPTICAGTPVSITANGATIYTWSPAAGLTPPTGSTVSAMPLATTQYTVTGTTNGCSGTGTVTVTVNPLPAKPIVTNPVSYCQNAVATALSATALPGHTLTWYSNPSLTGGSATVPTPSTATAGTTFYYVTQTNTVTSCVSDTSTIAVIITPAIANNVISAAQTICAGLPAAALTASPVAGGTGTYSYQWQQSTDGGATWSNIAGAVTTTYNPGTLATGLYHFRRLVNSGLCSSTSNTVIITVEANLTNYDISGVQTICEGIVPALINGQTPSGGTGTYTYVWQSSPDGTTYSNISGATGKDYQPAGLTANTYFRRITSGGNCPAISSAVLITVNPLPNALITAPPGICSYETADVSFTASAGTAPFTIQVSITAPGGGTSSINRIITSNGPFTFNVIPLNGAAGTYTVQLTSITDSKGCTRTGGFAPVSIVVTAKPVLAVSAASDPICEGSNTTLTATGATTYSWTPAAGLNIATGSTINASPASTTTYQVIGATNNCLDTASITVTVIPRPAKPVVTRQFQYCMNAPVTALTAIAAPGNTLTWYTNASLTGGSTTAPIPSTAVSGNFSYYVTQTNSNNCVSDTSVITVSVRPLPAVDFDLPQGICMPNGIGTFNNKTTIADNSVLNYAWNFGDGAGTSTATHPAYGYANSGSYQVTLTATSPYGCTATRSKTFSSFFEKPDARFTVNPAELCQGQNNVFTDRSNPRGSTITRWWWSFGDGTTPDAAPNPSHRYNRPDTFTVQLVVTTAIGCVSDTFKSDVIVHLQPRIDAGPSFTVPEGTVVKFKATANDTIGVRLLWTPPVGLSNPATLQPTLTATRNQTYTLTATGDGNCTAIDTMTVRILKQVEVPNVFSPNGDGIHDRWLIPNLAEYPGAKVEVFNRWGQQVFLSYGYNTAWDGTHLGKPLPLATYYYVITLNNGFKPVTGSVTIVK